MGNLRGYDMATIERLRRMGRQRLIALAASLVCALLVFIVVWLVNGFTTSWGVFRAGLALVEVLNQLIWGVAFRPTTAWYGALWAIGAVCHFTISTIEHHLWKLGDRRLYPVIALVAFLDIFTAAVAVESVFVAMGMQMSHAAATGIAEVIAILPEVMLALLFGALRKLAVYKSRGF